MSGLDEYCHREIASLNMTVTQLKARLQKGKLLLANEKDETRRLDIRAHWEYLKRIHDRAEVALEVLTAVRNPDADKWCSVCLGIVTEEEAKEFFADYKSILTGKSGVPQ